MKTLIALGMAVFVLSLVFSADLDAAETWEKELTAKGWENVTLESWADTTWYGYMMGRRNEQFEFVRYIHPDGRKLRVMNKTIGSKLSAKTWEWELEKNGKYCIVRLWPDGRPFGRICGKTIWKKDNSYIVVSLIGSVVSKWAIKKGNLEKF